MTVRNKVLTRRDFIQSAVAGSSLILLGCSSLDSLFTESRRIFDEEVLIVGGGLAGLSAAYHLKKNKVPYRLFEASDRIGGRIYSINGLGAPSLWGELGGEFVYGHQTNILGLAKELGFKPQLLKEKAVGEDLYLFKGKSFMSSSLKKQISPLAKALYELKLEVYQGQNFQITYENAERFEKVITFDQKSVADLVKELSSKVDEQLLAVLVSGLENRFGVAADQLSALHFLKEVRFQSGGTYILPGGWGQLTQTLYDRVSGGVPRFLVRGQHQLVSMTKSTLGIELNFKTPEGRRSYYGKRVIMALPMSAYSKLDGLDSFGFNEDKYKVVQSAKLGDGEKGIFVAENLKLSSSNYVLGDFESQAFWEASKVGTLSVNAYQRRAKDDIATTRLEQDLTKVSAVNNNVLKEVGPSLKWAKKSFIGGSLPYFGPGEYARSFGILGRTEAAGKILFAGDFMSVNDFATMEGAVHSGITAAESIISKIKV